MTSPIATSEHSATGLSGRSAPSRPVAPQPSGRAITIRGTVQGVGFRPWVYGLAIELGLHGCVRNDGRGVSIEAFGDQGALESLCRRLRSEVPAGAEIASFHWQPLQGSFEQDAFVIETSRDGGKRQASIPPDLATCAECTREVLDPNDRRYRYAFTNCTHCGPRFTITRGVPYDRPLTSMAHFPMCPNCLREYENPRDRRFHAQPNACPVCGPQLQVLDNEGALQRFDDPILAIAGAIAGGGIVAVKGIGGFHLTCDATSATAVDTLRRRKHRDAKPFAVMVRDLDAARRLATLSPTEERLLRSPERPIVLLRTREDNALGAALADGIAPGLPLVGLFLPYSPLHHLLLEAADRPLVMTSANLSNEPIAFRNEEALRRLRDVASLYLVHDREIVSRCDDSVLRVGDGGPVLLRRSRGYVPRPIRLHSELAEPVLACGADLKNTFCLGVGDCAYLGPHIGDLENLSAYEALGEAVEHFERFLGVTPRLIAHDLHPDYLSTRFALAQPGRHVAVQHHHAHLASVAAEHGLERDVLGVVFDGTGYGTDGTAWGGEILHGGFGGYRRVATFRPLALAGGDLAIREVWRQALALVDDAFEGAAPIERLALFASLDPRRVGLVRQQLATGVAVSQARGVGRLFDAIGALVLQLPISRYESEVALLLGELAHGTVPTRPYPLEIDRTQVPWQIDPRPLVRAVVADCLEGTAPELVSRRFHAALCAAAVDCLASAAERLGRPPVVLGGGCFANPVLLSGLRSELERSAAADLRLYLPRLAPPGDGGIALGQVLIADAVSRATDSNAVPSTPTVSNRGGSTCA